MILCTYTCHDKRTNYNTFNDQGSKVKVTYYQLYCYFSLKFTCRAYFALFSLLLLKSSLRKFHGWYGDLIKQYENFLAQMLNDIVWPDHMQWQPPTDQPLYRTRPFTEFWVVSIEHLRRVWHADRGRLLLRTPSLVPFGLAYVLLVEDQSFSELVVILPDYALRISLGTFSILLHNRMIYCTCLI